MDLEKQLDRLLEEMVLNQQKKVLHSARMLIPHLTAEDILNPHDFPGLIADPLFNYEEGIASGLLSARMAVRAFLQSQEKKDSRPDVNQAITQAEP